MSICVLPSASFSSFPPIIVVHNVVIVNSACCFMTDENNSKTRVIAVGVTLDSLSLGEAFVLDPDDKEMEPSGDIAVVGDDCIDGLVVCC